MRFDHNPEPFVQVGQTFGRRRFFAPGWTRGYAICCSILQSRWSGHCLFRWVGAARVERKQHTLESSIRFIKVCVDQLLAIQRRHFKPHSSQRFLTSITHAPCQNLMRQARHHKPQVAVATLEAIAHHQSDSAPPTRQSPRRHLKPQAKWCQENSVG